MLDPNFSKTVVLITQHGPGGSVGVVINRPTRTPLSRAFPKIEKFEKRPDTLFIGGPVQREVTILLLRTEKPPEAAVPVFEKVYVAPPVETLTDLLSHDDSKDPFRVYSGYAGWAPGQLQGEIDRGDWRVLPGDADLLFQEETGSIWEEMFRRSSQQLVEACRGDVSVSPRPCHRISALRSSFG
ncbi:MAG: YqgE/AlgH family protein [Candidatus Manganitrophus sp.]|nr:YqgE/AlgH family protein [Candidatus Manganitrophus sp.]